MSRLFQNRVPNLYRPTIFAAAIALILALAFQIVNLIINPYGFFGAVFGVIMCILFCFLAFGTADSLLLTVGSANMAVSVVILLVLSLIWPHQNTIVFCSIDLLCAVFLLCNSFISRYFKIGTWMKCIFFLPAVLSLFSLFLLEYSYFNGWFWGLLAIFLRACFYALSTLSLVLKSSKASSHFMSIPAHLVASLFTFGVWELSWIYRRTSFLNRLSVQQRSAKKELFLCMFLPFYYFYWMYKSAKIVDCYTKGHENPTKLSVLCLLLCFLPCPLASTILQDHINELVEAEGDGVEPAEEADVNFDNDDGKRSFIKWVCAGLVACALLVTAGVFVFTMILIPQNDYQAAVESGIYAEYINKYEIKEFEVPDGVTEIEPFAFYQCTTLESVTLPDSVESIGDSAFRKSGLREIRISSGVDRIGTYAFAECAYLERVTMAEGVWEIGAYAFAECDSLTHVVMAESVERIGVDVLKGCDQLEFLSVPFVGAKSAAPTTSFLAYFFGGTGYMHNADLIPKTLKTVALTNTESIFEDTFRGCKTVQAIVLPVELEYIRNKAFLDSDFQTIYYEGNEFDYMRLDVGLHNSNINSATVFYYSETAPSDEGNCWHYVNGVPTVWKSN